MNQLQIIGAVAKHTFIKVMRKPVILTFSFFQPMMWLFFFGFLFYRFPLEQLGSDISYVDFLLPGICSMTALFGASQSGVSIIRDIQSRFLYRILSTPANRSAILFGKILADVLRIIFQVLVIMGIGALVGVSYRINAIGLLQSFLMLIVFAFAFASVSCLIAIKAKEPEVMATFIHVVNMPILFTSTALVPSKQMPDWLNNIAQWNPLSIVTNSFRESLIYQSSNTNSLGLLLIVVCAVALFALNVYLLKKIKIE